MPQPRPGPSPTPSPEPVGAIEIKEILAMAEGAIIVPESEWIPPFEVDNDFMALNPEAGGFLVEFPDVICFMSASAYQARYGQMQE